MSHQNIEIKAKSNNHEKIREYLLSHDADFKGIDHQIDTYFNVPNGRLKLREGNIENYLIFYQRDEVQGLKQSKVTLYSVEPQSTLKQILLSSIGPKVVVDKKREIYFIDNVKFHIDTVADLGTFIEIEAIDLDGTLGIDKIQQQCSYYVDQFSISQADMISGSYSDLLMNK